MLRGLIVEWRISEMKMWKFTKERLEAEQEYDIFFKIEGGKVNRLFIL